MPLSLFHQQNPNLLISIRQSFSSDSTVDVHSGLKVRPTKMASDNSVSRTPERTLGKRFGEKTSVFRSVSSSVENGEDASPRGYWAIQRCNAFDDDEDEN